MWANLSFKAIQLKLFLTTPPPQPKNPFKDMADTFFNKTYRLFLNTVQCYNILISILLFFNSNI